MAGNGSGGRVHLASLCKCKPLWIGVVATMLSLGPFAIILSILFKWIADIPGTYLWNTAAGAVASILDFFGTCLIVWASEPERLGRRGAYFVLVLCSIITFAALILSGGGQLGGIVYLIIKAALSVVGGGNPQGAGYAILCAWFTDHAPPELHAAGFSILLGAQFLAMGTFPLLAMLVKPHVGGDDGILRLGGALSLLQVPLVLFCFPPKAERPQTALAEDPRETPAAPGGTATQDICAALRWIFKNRLSVAVCWISIAFVGAADSSNIVLFLTKGRQFTEDQVNTYIGILGMVGVVISFVVVPFCSKYLSNSAIVVVGVVATTAHCLIYAFFSSVELITSLAFVGSLMYGAIPTLLSYMPKESDSGVPQGVLLGVFQGLRSPPTIFGPPILAACLQAEVDSQSFCYAFPWQSFVGGGFVVMAVFMLPALFASLALYVREFRQDQRTVAVEGVVPSLPKACSEGTNA